MHVPAPGRRDKDGLALVIVLAFLVLLTVLIVGFFATATTELTASKSYADGITVRQLADTAVNVVMGQIRDASTTPNGDWASQPGMVRVFRNGTAAASTPYAYYKLYSSDKLILNAGDATNYNPTLDIPEGPGGWNHTPALYTDLNESVTTITPGNASSIPTEHFPVFDPAAANVVEGFKLGNVPGDDSGRKARMPVRWLYVLKDGSLTAPSGSDDQGRTAVWDGSGVSSGNQTPTAANPIVGRVAFWTDDDSCKVNINTAGGFSNSVVPTGYNQNSFAGCFWDTPRFATMFDRGLLDGTTGLFAAGQAGLSFCQPVRNEFQRYAGHPSTTSLSVVFGSMFGKPFSSEQLYALSPRLANGGSKGGTTRLLSTTDQPLSPKTNRLYASVDEFLMSQLMVNGKRMQNDAMLQKTLPGEPAVTMTPGQIEKLRFFLTAHSRAPELNLYGRPRITLWPINTDATLLNASDRLIAFCSTLGPSTDRRPFLFSRKDPYSPTTDSSIARNQTLFSYLQRLTSQAIPGFGGTFSAKYGQDRDQILTEMFDYIRCVNLRDSTHDLTIQSTFPQSQWQTQKDKYKFAPRGVVVPIRFNNNVGFGRFPTISEAALVFYHAGYLSTALDTKTKQPFAYYDRKAIGTNGISGIYVRAFLILETYNPMQGYAPINSPISTDVSANNVIIHEITGLDQFSIQTPNMAAPASLGMPPTGVNHITVSSGGTWNGQNSGGQEGFMHTLWPKCGRMPGRDAGGGVIPANSEYYPFQSPGPGVLIPKGDTTFNFSGGTLTLNIKFGSNLVRQLNLNFRPGLGWPVPNDEIWTDAGGFNHNTGFQTVNSPALGTQWNTLQEYSQFSFANRLVWAIQHSASPWSTLVGGDGTDYANRWRQIVQPGDTVRSLLFQDPGDLRAACLADSGPNSNGFVPHPNYNTNVPQAQALRCANGAVYYNAKDLAGKSYTTTFGNLVALPTGKSYPGSIAAKLPPTVKGATMGTGLAADFDTGIGNLADGAFCGKADEGNLAWRYWDSYNAKWVYVYPYFTWDYEETFDTFFTPNRQVPSAVVFGSLLAGKNRQWQTLCFSPNPAAGARHPGLQSPPDHLFLDLFTMPIVEPYAISEPFSTAGKINMNYPIMPFTYIQRTTGLRAALQATRVSAVPVTDVSVYKTPSDITKTANYRFPVDRDQTLASIDSYLTTNGNKPPNVFRSASQICERYLYPTGTIFVNGDSKMITYWNSQTLTGDNVREKPYGDLYPRLTTKSNTYTVHMRVQVLRPTHPPAGAPGTNPYQRWTEKPDSIASEYRGYSIIERYIDPQDRRFDKSNAETQARQDYIDVDNQSLEDAYRFRIVESKQFTP